MAPLSLGSPSSMWGNTPDFGCVPQLVLTAPPPPYFPILAPPPKKPCNPCPLIPALPSGTAWRWEGQGVPSGFHLLLTVKGPQSSCISFWPEHGDPLLLPVDICPFQPDSFKALHTSAEAALHTAPHANGQTLTCTQTHAFTHMHCHLPRAGCINAITWEDDTIALINQRGHRIEGLHRVLRAPLTLSLCPAQADHKVIRGSTAGRGGQAPTLLLRGRAQSPLQPGPRWQLLVSPVSQ